jgi:exopolysaccharide production protein ExoZ
VNYYIQYLRAIAAITTVAFHIIVISNNYNYNYPNFFNIGTWGKHGVDLFFVISGYIIVYVQDISKKDFKTFLWNRSIRIIPTYYFLTTIMVLLLVIFPNIFLEMKSQNEIFFRSYLFLSSIYSHRPVIYVGWSIEYELFFYFIFAVSILFKNKIDEKYFTLIVIFLIFYLLNLNLIILEFCLGILVYLFSKKVKLNNLNSIFIFLLGLFIFIFNPIVDHNLHGFFTYGISSALILFGVLNLKQYKFNTLKFLGDASYSIYLIQVFTISFFFKVLKYFPVNGFEFLFFLLNILFTVLVGSVFYLIFEKKILQFKKSKKLKK